MVNSNCFDWSVEGVGGKGRVVGDSKCFDWLMEGVGGKGRVVGGW